MIREILRWVRDEVRIFLWKNGLDMVRRAQLPQVLVKRGIHAVIDVGANVGSYTILASGVVRCPTVAFEPDPLTAAAFERNINLNRIADLVEIRITAVGERQGIVRFSTGLDTENHVVAETEPSGRDVPIETLDHAFVETTRIPALIKLDVEGYETAALQGAQETLKKA